MRVAIGNDHGGVELKQHLVGYLEKNGYEVEDDKLQAEKTKSAGLEQKVKAMNEIS